MVAATGKKGKQAANYARASRKDFRDAVTAARGAFAGWSKQSAYLRGQILYRAAEMLEMREAELRTEVERGPGGRAGAERSAADNRSSGLLCRLDGQVQFCVWIGEPGRQLAF